MIANHSLHSPMQPHHPTLTYFYFFFFNDTATTEIYTLSLHDALPIRLYMPSFSAAWARKASRCRSAAACAGSSARSEEHTSELQSHVNLVCRLLLEKKKNYGYHQLHSHMKAQYP